MFQGVTHSAEATIEFLREAGILHRTPPNCQICGRIITEVKNDEKTDGQLWRRPDPSRRDSFLENAHVKLDDFVILKYLWGANATAKLTAQVTGLVKPAVIDWFHFVRDACAKWMSANRPIVGGVGPVAQIDESVVSKAKYNRGRHVPERWVFGGYDTTTPLPLIKKYILPGTEIYSDVWRVRHIPVQPPYQHQTVNRSRNFVDPVTGACTNAAEGMWRRAKRKIVAANGTSRGLLVGYLEEYLWRERNGKDGPSAFESILRHIAEWYCENRENVPV